LKSEASGHTPADDSNPWWRLLVDAVEKAGGRIGTPETRYSTTDGRFVRRAGIPTIGFSPISNSPIRQHASNEVKFFNFLFNLIHNKWTFFSFSVWFV
jgi:acetylornithine deacetylase/succinyl-diaminopimelate desuccinylase-like protein